MYGAFKNICQMSQKSLKKYVTKELNKKYTKVINGDGYVYAQGEFPVLLVAHLDTVHKNLPTIIHYDTNKQVLSSPYGIGGDDRCGVYMIFETIKKYNCSVLFCEDEEIGAKGAEKFIKTKLAKELEFNYIIEFDRRGSNDAVFYDCDNEDFERFITKDFFKTAWGSFSDISVLAPFLKCAAVNLSCGYYEAHTNKEYVVLPEMKKSIEEACKILERTTEKDKFEYIEAKVYGNYGIWNDVIVDDCWYVQYIDENNEEEWVEVYATSKIEAIGKFCMAYPSIPYMDIIDVYGSNELYGYNPEEIW